MKLSHIIIKLIAGFVLASCSDIANQEKARLVLAPRGQVSETAVLDFETVNIKIFSVRCVGCHQQYSTYQGVFKELTAIQDAVKNNRMPKSGRPLDNAQKELLAKWISGGAPEKSDGLIPPDTPEILEPNWNSLLANLIVPKCLVCHNPNGQAKFLDLSTRQKIYDSRNRLFADNIKLINLDSIDQSYLLQILSDVEEPMPPVWSKISRLTVNESLVFKQWLALGLP